MGTLGCVFRAQDSGMRGLGCGDVRTHVWGNVGTWDTGTQTRGDAGTQGRGDLETQGLGDARSRTWRRQDRGRRDDSNKSKVTCSQLIKGTI